MNITISKHAFFASILCTILIASLLVNIFLIIKIEENILIYQKNQVNSKVLAFRNMFSEKVLLASGDIDFDTRLALETSVRSLDDPEIFEQWQKFTKCETKQQATEEAKKLLSLLIKKTAN